MSSEEVPVGLNVCTAQRIAHCTVITLPGQLDATNAGSVSEELLRTLNRGPGVLIVDMSGTSFCAVAGVHTLMRARGRASAAGIGLRVVVTATIVRRVLRLTGTDRALELYPSVHAAVAGLPGPAANGSAAHGSAADGSAVDGGEAAIGRTGQAEEVRR
jgi:anti-anti-sigma factor